MSNDSIGCADIHSVPNAALQEQHQPQNDEDMDPQRFPASRRSIPPSPRQLQASHEDDKFAETVMNRALYDPPRWGWTAVGGIADVLSPHEVRC